MFVQYVVPKKKKFSLIPISLPPILSTHRDRTSVKKLALYVAKNHVRGADFCFFLVFMRMSKVLRQYFSKFLCFDIVITFWLLSNGCLCLSNCLSYYLSYCLFVYLSVCLSVCLSVHLSVSPMFLSFLSIF